MAPIQRLEKFAHFLDMPFEIEIIFLSTLLEFESVCSVGECAPSLQCRGVQDDVPVQVWGSLCGEGHTLSVRSL